MRTRDEVVKGKLTVPQSCNLIVEIRPVPLFDHVVRCLLRRLSSLLLARWCGIEFVIIILYRLPLLRFDDGLWR
jgi:hypothetical protein